MRLRGHHAVRQEDWSPELLNELQRVASSELCENTFWLQRFGRFGSFFHRNSIVF